MFRPCGWSYVKSVPSLSATGQPDAATAVRHWLRHAGRVVFGDRLGLVVFLVGQTFATCYWRISIFLTDSYAIGNTLVNVAEGHFSIRGIIYSLTFGSQPGLFVVDGAVYGRNYGHVFVSLPVLWVLDVLSSLFDLRLVLAAGWSLLVFALFNQVGRLIDRRHVLVSTGVQLRW